MSDTTPDPLNLDDLDLADIGGVVTAPAPTATLAVPAANPTAAVAPAPTPAPTKPRATTTRSGSKSIRPPLYFDLETVPDDSRLEWFGLEPLPVHPEYKPSAACPAASEIIGKTVPELTALLADLQPCDGWLGVLEAVERDGKCRKGVLDLIADVRRGRRQIDEAAALRCKMMSTCPEMCRIVSAAWAVGDGDVTCLNVGPQPNGGDMPERVLVEHLWQLMKSAGKLVGFGCAGFDLPVIYMRSVVLGVESQRAIDRKPWGPDVEDLMLARYGSIAPKDRGLKFIAKALGIEVPGGDDDGGKVYEMVQAGEWERLRTYNASDVEITRELHRKFKGFFCQ